MIFNYPLTVPANTQPETPAEKTLRLTYGILHQIDIESSHACVGMVYGRIMDALHQVFPTNPDEQFKLTGAPITGKVFHWLPWEPFELQLQGWSPGTNYDHDIIVRLWVLRPGELFPLSEQAWKGMGL